MESGQTKADITVQRKYRESGGGVMLPGNGTTGRLQLCVALGDQAEEGRKQSNFFEATAAEKVNLPPF